MTQNTAGDLEEEEEDDGTLVHGRPKRKVAFMPSLGKQTHAHMISELIQ